jgi:hypothetical protein
MAVEIRVFLAIDAFRYIPGTVLMLPFDRIGHGLLKCLSVFPFVFKSDTRMEERVKTMPKHDAARVSNDPSMNRRRSLAVRQYPGKKIIPKVFSKPCACQQSRQYPLLRFLAQDAQVTHRAACRPARMRVRWRTAAFEVAYEQAPSEIGSVPTIDPRVGSDHVSQFAAQIDRRCHSDTVLWPEPRHVTGPLNRATIKALDPTKAHPEGRSWGC